jgi:hypothetical protein
MFDQSIPPRQKIATVRILNRRRLLQLISERSRMIPVTTAAGVLRWGGRAGEKARVRVVHKPIDSTRSNQMVWAKKFFIEALRVYFCFFFA